jgi:hypothetical protein
MAGHSKLNFPHAIVAGNHRTSNSLSFVDKLKAEFQKHDRLAHVSWLSLSSCCCRSFVLCCVLSFEWLLCCVWQVGMTMIHDYSGNCMNMGAVTIKDLMHNVEAGLSFCAEAFPHVITHMLPVSYL